MAGLDTLTVFNKTIDNVGFIVGDNCATNKAVADHLHIPLVGCASHRLNLAVQAYLQQHEHLIQTIHVLMVRLKTNKNRGYLRQHTHLAPKVQNATRWTSTFTMLERFMAIKDHLPFLRDVVDLIPSPGAVVKVEQLIIACNEFHGYTLALQKDDINLLEVRQLFDELIKRYPVMARELAANAAIVKSPVFEAAVVKVLGKKESLMTDEECDALEMFKLPVSCSAPQPVDTTPVDPRMLAFHVLSNKRKRSEESAGSSYSNLQYIIPTSNVVERLFSKAKLVYSDRRQRMLPITLEAIMFLATNRNFWDEAMVEDVLRSTPIPDVISNTVQTVLHD
ncbi:hypothetical protein SDRG_11436 [Saprolegnia diclina VS20]|uniref:HAT C-terminal dimerisation domain-containing protein n=1 Tax=Saprolegnia diclina (strain VS20) TaxID=1156394 RepID=T0RFA6_SAPDV|nr:hypothetical protein SDRG_11436 [Saprolegnia diclina VS20]XP_008618446.1 hypothetical protein SDRG_14117 [Saprolegnia diclina VS20]EQC28160.1 hypothetical protein SDRG_14117 [Saprolegnia diclina VS20]EQC30963.1 hypothetical protein SDRG_11436 [Saprolegnia diclina VS20]|eukprot:XP_008615701.1 hypothetical protein SDRG_11436 [Saprolegnia diclina VS20]